MTELIIQKKCIINGKHLDIGSLTTLTDTQAETLIKQGYAIKRISKQNVSASETKQAELSTSSNTEVQELSTSENVQTTISKRKQIKKK